MACSMNLPNRDASGLVPGDAPSNAGGGMVAWTRVATGSVGCQYLPGGLGKEPHCHASWRTYERRMTTQRGMLVVLNRAGTVSAMTPTPKGRALEWVFGFRGRGFGVGLCLGAGPSTPVPWSGAGGSLTHSIAGGAVGSFRIFPWKRLSGNTRRHDWSACFGFLGLGLVFVVWRFGPLTPCCRWALLGRSAWAWWFGRAAAAPPADYGLTRRRG